MTKDTIKNWVSVLESGHVVCEQVLSSFWIEKSWNNDKNLTKKIKKRLVIPFNPFFGFFQAHSVFGLLVLNGKTYLSTFFVSHHNSSCLKKQIIYKTADICLKNLYILPPPCDAKKITIQNLFHSNYILYHIYNIILIPYL